MSDWRTIRFRLAEVNYEKLFTTSALHGDSMETTLNRAVDLYEACHRATAGTVLSWNDRDGSKREVVVLPIKLRGPRWLRWLGVQYKLERTGK